MTFEEFSNRIESAISCSAGGSVLGGVFGSTGSLIGAIGFGIFGFLNGR